MLGFLGSNFTFKFYNFKYSDGYFIFGWRILFRIFSVLHLRCFIFCRYFVCWKIGFAQAWVFFCTFYLQANFQILEYNLLTLNHFFLSCLRLSLDSLVSVQVFSFSAGRGNVSNLFWRKEQTLTIKFRFLSSPLLGFLFSHV